MTDSLELYVGARQRDGTRVVHAKYDGHEHRDQFNTDIAWQRERFVTALCERVWPADRGPRALSTERLLSLGTDAEIADPLDTIDDRIVAAADAADEAELQRNGSSRTTDAVVVVCLADVKPEPIRWLWPGRFALGKLTLVAGDPGLGKSLLSLDLAARVALGAPWPDDGSSCAPRGSAILLSAEDDVTDTIRPRLDAIHVEAAAWVYVVQAIRGTDEDGEYVRTVDLSRDLTRIEDAIRKLPNCRLVIIDPISAYLGRTDTHRNSDTRAVLAPLAELAARHRVAVVAVTHLRKSSDGSALHRSIGSVAFIAAARSAWVVAADRADPSRRLFLPIKNNLGRPVAGLAFRVVPVGEYARLEWEADPVTIDADEALGRGGDDDHGSALSEAVEWLSDVLADGPKTQKEIMRQAEADGIKERTLRRAKDKLGVDSYREGTAWLWRLPEPD